MEKKDLCLKPQDIFFSIFFPSWHQKKPGKGLMPGLNQRNLEKVLAVLGMGKISEKG